MNESLIPTGAPAATASVPAPTAAVSVPFLPDQPIMPAPAPLHELAQLLAKDFTPEHFGLVSTAMTSTVHTAVVAALGTMICSEQDFAAATERLNLLGKARVAAKNRQLALTRVYDAAADAYRAALKPYLDTVAAAEAHLGKEIAAFRKLQEEQRRAALEAQRRQAEAEARAKREAEARKAALEAEAEETRRQADLQAQRLKWEADKREAGAVASLDAAVGDEVAFEGAAAKFDKALQVGAQAEAVLQDGNTKAQAISEEARAVEVPVAPVAHVAQPLPEVTKAKGVKFRKKARVISVDLKALPLEYHLADTGKIEKAILMGLVTVNTPGVVFAIEEIAAGSGR